VLIAGAGPTGLVLAAWLTAQGVRVRIIDKSAAPAEHSRALAVQARTLELYRQLDLTDEVLARSHIVPGVNLWVRGRPEARVPFDSIAQDLTPYTPLVFPQDEHERLLIGKLEALGIRVERNTELLEFSDTGEQIRARLRGPDGESRCEARYLAGCDGGSSAVRRALGEDFPGGTYQQVFYVADVQASGPALNGELHVDLDEADFLAVFPLKGAGRARLIGTVRDERAERAQTLEFRDVSERAIQHMKVQVQAVNWFSTYRVHHRVVEHFRRRRTFLLGDAAHIHSPAGGQGMNTGIGDAINLAWKLAAVLGGRAGDALLDTYESERRAFARRLVASTDRGFTLATAEGQVAGAIRMHLLPLILPPLFRLSTTRIFLFSAVSQISIRYRDSAISQGSAGRIHGGDRLPWVRTREGDNLESLRPIGWHVHVYGSASARLARWCERHGLPLHLFPWQESYARAGLAQDALYLIRPDMYVALANAGQDPEALERYFKTCRLRIT